MYVYLERKMSRAQGSELAPSTVISKVVFAGTEYLG